MIGTSFNQYRITAIIGAGGMGEALRARHTRLDRDAAVKVLPKDEDSIINTTEPGMVLGTPVYIRPNRFAANWPIIARTFLPSAFVL